MLNTGSLQHFNVDLDKGFFCLFSRSFGFVVLSSLLVLSLSLSLSLLFFLILLCTLWAELSWICFADFCLSCVKITKSWYKHGHNLGLSYLLTIFFSARQTLRVFCPDCGFYLGYCRPRISQTDIPKCLGDTNSWKWKINKLIEMKEIVLENSLYSLETFLCWFEKQHNEEWVGCLCSSQCSLDCCSCSLLFHYSPDSKGCA